MSSIYTLAQLKTKISSGDFSNLGIGDYYEKTVNSVTTKWRIAAADYFLHHGSSETTAHHLVMVPDDCIGTSYMNSTNVTTGGYIGSYMYSTTIPSVNSWVSAAFGSSYMLAHDELLSNTVDTGKASSGYTGYAGASSNWGWKSMTCNIMSEPMVYGGPICSSSFFDTGNRHNQLPLFKLAPGLICNRATWWLSSVAASTYFCFVDSYGPAGYHNASSVLGVRPYFLFA